MLYVVVDEPNVEDQEGSGAGAKLFSQVMEDLLPYLNVYATNSDDVSYDGTDEAVSADDETVTEVDTEADISSDDAVVDDGTDDSYTDDTSDGDSSYTVMLTIH